MRIYLIYFIFVILCFVILQRNGRNDESELSSIFSWDLFGPLKDRHMRTFVFVACIYVRVRAYGVTCQKMTEATAQPAARLGIVISPRYEFYFLVCFSRLTISLPRGEQRFAPAAPKSEKAERYYALIERVGISGNRRRLVDSLSSPFISRNARPNMISEIERCLINFNRQSNTFICDCYCRIGRMIYRREITKDKLLISW